MAVAVVLLVSLALFGATVLIAYLGTQGVLPALNLFDLTNDVNRAIVFVILVAAAVVLYRTFKRQQETG